MEIKAPQTTCVMRKKDEVRHISASYFLINWELTPLPTVVNAKLVDIFKKGNDYANQLSQFSLN